MNLLRVLRTVGPLKPIQIYGRLIWRLHRPRPDLRPAPARRAFTGVWTAPVPRPPSLIGPCEARFLNETRRFEGAEGWNDPARDRLWLYHLHYFDYLAAPVDTERTAWRRAMIDRWIAENPPGRGVGWEPFPTAIRIVNWIKWMLAGTDPGPGWLDSLAAQARFLAANLEWRLLGNHILADAKALIFAGLFFEGAEAERWLAKGLSIHRQQLAEQVLDDGGHSERSPMYHALVLEDALDLLNLVRASGTRTPTDDWIDPIGRMRVWLGAMTHPDGRISFFNDAAFGVAPTLEEINAYASRLDLPPRVASPSGATILSPSGYIRLARDEAVVLIDAAPVGPDHQPGHAHADTLSFELSLGKERIVVNGGTSLYREGAERQGERSTAAHSTVEIDGCDSSEVWAGFRVGRRARVLDRSTVCEREALIAAAAHDGYRWRPDRPIHRRTWRLEAGHLTVTDTIEGRCSSALARFHLGPGVQALNDGDGREGVITTPAGRTVRWTTSEAARIEPSLWRPEFGVRIETRQLIVAMGAQVLRTEFRW